MPKIKFASAAWRVALLFILLALIAGCQTPPKFIGKGKSDLIFETVHLPNGDAPITLNLAYRTNTIAHHPAILMLGSIVSNELPSWSTNLVNEGYLLAAFTADYPPDPDPRRRPQWLYFDQRFAHSYVLGGHRAAKDAGVVIDYLVKRGDVPRDKIGWLGSSSTGIPGLFVTTEGPRLAAIVAFVSTGACREWFDTWHFNGLWRGNADGLWPETEKLLAEYDPILFATNAFPTAVLMINGGTDKIVDAKTARSFVEAARPAYRSDPERLRFIVYEGFGHNLPADIVQTHAEQWFHLYMNPATAAPVTPAPPANLRQSVARSQINATDHRQIVGATDADTATATIPATATRPASTTTLEPLRLSADKRSFITANSKQPFVAWGFNYDRDYKSRLLEDYWDAEWGATGAKDFREMKKLGANAVRIHLQLTRFMDAPNKPNEHALHQLDRLVRLAEDTGLYLDLTGLGCYRKKDVPNWYASLSEKDRWTVQAQFWSAVARHCSRSSAILCYDLMNEPIVPAGKRKPDDWLAGELGGFNYIQFISLDQAGRSRAEIARQWIAALSDAIRKQDSQHFITIGMLPDGGDLSGFTIAKVAPQLDYLSVHIYPSHGKLSDDLATARRFQVGKALVVEEMFPMKCSAAELREFINSAKPLANGWLGFYWGQTPEQLRPSTNLVDGLTRDWLQVFQQGKP